MKISCHGARIEPATAQICIRKVNVILNLLLIYNKWMIINKSKRKLFITVTSIEHVKIPTKEMRKMILRNAN